MEKKSLYCDGGVVTVNPSPYAGTWAYRILTDGVVVAEQSGIITPAQARMDKITNNLTEMLAALNAMRALPGDWTGEFCSDSQITLGRLFLGWKWTGIPAWMHKLYNDNRVRLTNYTTITPILLDGHPTRAQLAAGIGKRGHPVSEHNVFCDHACGERAKEFLSGQ